MKNKVNYAVLLDELRNISSQDNPDVGTAFFQFSKVTKELATLQENLVSHFISDFFHDSQKAF